MGKKIICENLPLNKKVRDLLELLDPVGTVQWVYMVTEPNTRQFTGQAFVELWSDTEAELVISKLHGNVWDGQAMQIRMVLKESTPDTWPDKTLALTAPYDYIYSVIRFQVSAPPGSIVFVNDVPKEVADDGGLAVVRALLPGDYEVKVVYQNMLLTTRPLSVNCDEAPPRLKVDFDTSGIYSADSYSSYSTYSSDAALPPPVSVADIQPYQPPVITQTQPARVGRRWLWAAAMVLVIMAIGGVIAVPRLMKDDKKAAALPPPPEGMALVPSGRFTIGRNTGDEYEAPAHPDGLGYNYFMDTFEVTNEDYWIFIRETSRTPPKHWEGRTPPTSMLRLPVTHVSLEDALAYCKWRGTRKNLNCRVPSEIEWERAARGDTGLLYTWGNEWREGATNANSKNGKIMPIGSFPADKSPYGIYDLMGNVREWTRDSFTPYQGSRGKPVAGVNTIRGGAYSDSPQEANSTYRSYGPPDALKFDRTGFRCVCDVPEPIKTED